MKTVHAFIPRLAAALLLTTAFAVPVSAQDLVGDPDAGARFAQRACAGCHVVGGDWPANPRNPAPAFERVAAEPSVTPLGLRVFLNSPHRNMPNLILSEKEVDDVIAYIMALRPMK
ncbi:MAG: cytochrome c [Rhodospirillaceae bacterium]|nr:cytochrome c [Rhodospirillaceae bacterium]MBT5943198.1 cytochrome c [Rhodospirillaceae bacterium]MBT6405560.1 cytochrome c [Rhodospirillaceae bacterium]MBT6535409.1 cytochrome c [Rhodospirillaceae bacterium]